MNWIPKFLNKQTCKNPQQPEELKKQDFTGVIQTVAEETILAMAYWLIGLVKQTMQNQATSQQAVEETIPSSTTAAEELLPKVSTLIEQLYERSQAMIALENRLGAVENLLVEKTAPEPPVEASIQSVSNLESRLASVESLLKTLDAQTGKGEQIDQNLAMLESRMTNLEKLLSRYSVVPRVVDQNAQAIAALQQRITILESSRNGGHINSPDSVLVMTDRQ